jgi:hypothetical protein
MMPGLFYQASGCHLARARLRVVISPKVRFSGMV